MNVSAPMNISDRLVLQFIVSVANLKQVFVPLFSEYTAIFGSHEYYVA